MALVAIIGLNVDERDADPKDTYALIFGIVAAFLILMFFFQSRDLSAAERAETKAAIAQAEIENPATMEEPALWASMAVKPIDKDALRARKDVWGAARGSMRLGMVICLLIFLAVPPIYLLDTFVPLLVGVPLIAIIALWKSGERHGREVTVRMPADESTRSMCQVLVVANAPEFEFRSRDGRLKAADGAPAAVAEALKSIPNSPRWNGLKGKAGPEGVVVEHKGVGHGDWLLDLWLAERLAAAL